MAKTRITLISLWSEGGMLHYVARLSAALAKQPSLAVSVVLPRDADTYLFSADVQLKPVNVPDKLSIANLLRLASGLSFVSLFRTIKSSRPDIVHYNSSHLLLIALAPILARMYKTVAHVHDAVSHPGSDEKLRKTLERRAVLRHASRIFVHRQVIRDQLLNQFDDIDPQRVVIAPHGNYDFFADFDVEQEREPATLLFFGRISVYKGLTYLVQAVEMVRDRIPGLRVIIAGSGEFEPDVEARLGSSVYEIHNRFIDDAEVAGFFRRATAVVLPYVEASESGVLRVAEAFSRPVISTRVGGIPEAIRHEEMGLIVEPADADGLARAIERLLTNSEFRQRIETNMKAVKDQRPDWGEAADIISRSYADLLGTGSAPGVDRESR